MFGVPGDDRYDTPNLSMLFGAGDDGHACLVV